MRSREDKLVISLHFPIPYPPQNIKQLISKNETEPNKVKQKQNKKISIFNFPQLIKIHAVSHGAVISPINDIPDPLSLGYQNQPIKHSHVTPPGILSDTPHRVYPKF